MKEDTDKHNIDITSRWLWLGLLGACAILAILVMVTMQFEDVRPYARGGLGTGSETQQEMPVLYDQ